MSYGSRISRRTMLKSAAVGMTLPLLREGTAIAEEKKPASDRIGLGFIGVGMMGRGHLSGFLRNPEVQVLAVCEVEKTRRENAVASVESAYAEEKKSGSYKGCSAYTDLRELLARPDIDAVLIATPDHWHALACLLAARARKDIYCEKPLTHSIREGRMIVDAVRESRVIFQTGSQQRSEFGNRFRTAVEYVWNGRIGKLKSIRVGVGGPPVACDLPEMEAPADVDWDTWLGPAEWRGYNEILCPKGMHQHFPAFRNYREFAGGALADMGAHHFDIGQWAMEMDSSGPVRIEPPNGGETSGLRFVYASGVEMIHGGPSGCTFEGSEGTIYVDRDKLESMPESILKESLTEKDRRVVASNNHHQNWIDSIRSRQPTICTAETGHRTASICHLANIAYRLQRALNWDPQLEQFENDDEANRLLFRTPREKWRYGV